mgnify:CR=1 FL=1
MTNIFQQFTTKYNAKFGGMICRFEDSNITDGVKFQQDMVKKKYNVKDSGDTIIDVRGDPYARGSNMTWKQKGRIYVVDFPKPIAINELNAGKIEKLLNPYVKTMYGRCDIILKKNDDSLFHYLFASNTSEHIQDRLRDWVR